MVDRQWTDDDDDRTPYDAYTISSPCEPNGSGELIIGATVSRETKKEDTNLIIPNIYSMKKKHAQ